MTIRAIEAVDAKRQPAHCRAAGHRGPGWARRMKFTINEARSSRPGNTAVLGRLTELMFVEILREYMQQLPEDHGGWLAGLNDPHVGKALRLLHASPMRNWTVDELSREVAMSRSALAERFTLLVGDAPMRYLANWRMQIARQLLREGAHSIQESRRVSGAVRPRSTGRSSAPPVRLRHLAHHGSWSVHVKRRDFGLKASELRKTRGDDRFLSFDRVVSQMSEAGESVPTASSARTPKCRDVPSHEIAGPPSANGPLISLPQVHRLRPWVRRGGRLETADVC